MLDFEDRSMSDISIMTRPNAKENYYLFHFHNELLAAAVVSAATIRKIASNRLIRA